VDAREFYRMLAAALAGNGPLPVGPAEPLHVLQVLQAAGRSAPTAKRRSGWQRARPVTATGLERRESASPPSGRDILLLTQIVDLVCAGAANTRPDLVARRLFRPRSLQAGARGRHADRLGGADP
jgi:hypothetical protein